jgi:hypothetical protein
MRQKKGYRPVEHLLRAGLAAVAIAFNLSAAAAEAVPQAAAIDARVRKDVLNELALQLESRYVIESTAKQLADLVRSKQKANAYKNIKTGPELARALTDDLATVAHDKHLHVYYTYTPMPKNAPGPPPKEFLEQVRKLNGFVPKVEILDGNVGYMRVNGVPPLDVSRRAVAAAFAFLHDTDALIIDNRGNGGGDPDTVALYVSYLSEGQPHLVNSFHWREGKRVDEFKTSDVGELSYGAQKPVYVLTSHMTFSGGEELSYDLQVTKRALIVGEVTGGGANPGGPVSLGHQFGVNMPNGQAVNPITGTSWEGKGVEPDVSVPPAAALSKALALAIERLAGDASDPGVRSELNSTLLKLRSIEEARADHVARLSHTDLVGNYALQPGPGAPISILEKDGQLIQRVGGVPDVTLIPFEGNRYLHEGHPDEFVTSFVVSNGKTDLILEEPPGPPTAREKQ